MTELKRIKNRRRDRILAGVGLAITALAGVVAASFVGLATAGVIDLKLLGDPDILVVSACASGFCSDFGRTSSIGASVAFVGTLMLVWAMWRYQHLKENGFW